MTNKTLATLALLGAIGLAGCGKLEFQNLSEQGTVYNKRYIPERKENVLNPIIIPLGESGLGMTSTGKVGIRGTLVSEEQTIPENYEVSINTDDHKFILRDKTGKNLYFKLEEGEKVIVNYKKGYFVRYKDIDGDGDKDVVKKKLIYVKFFDASSMPSKEIK